MDMKHGLTLDNLCGAQDVMCRRALGLGAASLPHALHAGSTPQTLLSGTKLSPGSDSSSVTLPWLWGDPVSQHYLYFCR